MVPSLNVGTGDNDLYSVSCVTTHFCVAAGDAGTNHTLLERWNGIGWTVMAHADPVGTHYAVLNGVSCSTTTFCQAVGFWRASATHNELLADRWNGSACTTLATPSPHPTLSEWFTGVSCHDSKFCMAFGVASSSFTDRTVADEWTGVRWSLAP